MKNKIDILHTELFRIDVGYNHSIQNGKAKIGNTFLF